MAMQILFNKFEFVLDGVTKRWLENIIDPVFGHPQFVRFSWSTCSEMLKKKAVKRTNDYAVTSHPHPQATSTTLTSLDPSLRWIQMN